MSILPDVLDQNLKVVFCGTAAGNESAKQGAYYAGPGNQFWDVLYRVGLTSRKLRPIEYRKLLEYGRGLTDLVKKRFGSDNELSKADYDIKGFKEKIIKCSPAAIAFNGKTSAEVYFDHKVNYGKQSTKIKQTSIFVLPSTSGAARGYWDEAYWRELANYISHE